MRVGMRCCSCFAGASVAGRDCWLPTGWRVVMFLLGCYYELFSRSEQHFLRAFLQTRRVGGPRQRNSCLGFAARTCRSGTQIGLWRCSRRCPASGRGGREELFGSARALSTTKVWGPPPEGVEEVVGEIVAEHPTPKSLFCLRRGALFALTPDLTPDFTSDFTPDFTSGFTRTLDVWLAPERTSQFRQRRKTEQTAYTQNCFG